MDLDRLLDLLPVSLRDDDAGEASLRGLLEPVATVDDLLTLRRDKLAQLLDPETCPDELIAYLAELVGVGPLTLSASVRATPAELRQLVAAAVATWKTKGGTPSWRRSVSALLGSRALVLSWFELRWVTGLARAVHLLPCPGSTGTTHAYPEQVIDLWFMNPDQAATPDTDLIERWLDVLRGAGERVNLWRALMLDDLDAGESLWERFGSGSWDFDGDAHELVATDGAGFLADLDGAGATWSTYRTTMRIAVDGAGYAWGYVGASTDDAYRVEVDQAGGALELRRVNAGVVSAALDSAAVALVAGYGYDLSIDLVTDFASTTIKVWLEGLLLLEHVDSSGDRLGAGGVAFQAQASSTVAVSAALTFHHGTTPTRIGPTP